MVRHSGKTRLYGGTILVSFALMTLVSVCVVQKGVHGRLQALDSMSGENEIRVAMFRAVRLVAQADDASQLSAYTSYVKAGVGKLANGWPGFKTNQYHPSGYSDKDLLGEVYGEVCRIIKTGGARNQRQMRELLRDLKPAEDELLRMWKGVIKLHGIDENTE